MIVAQNCGIDTLNTSQFVAILQDDGKLKSKFYSKVVSRIN